MDITAYIASGIIEEYCLGLLDADTAAEVVAVSAQYPEIDRAIHDVRRELAPPVSPPPAALKGNIMALIAQLEEEKIIDPANPPLLHRHSDAAAWQLALRDCTPQFEYEGNAYHIVTERPEQRLCVVWVNHQLLEDGHEPTEFRESFLILEGECECDFEGQVFQLRAGDYLDIPPHTRHIFRNISSEPLTAVKVLVQRC
jgi:mannose-6-phosphate isomerase-like protein (cupin superfamily)